MIARLPTILIRLRLIYFRCGLVCNTSICKATIISLKLHCICSESRNCLLICPRAIGYSLSIKVLALPFIAPTPVI